MRVPTRVAISRTQAQSRLERKKHHSHQRPLQLSAIKAIKAIIHTSAPVSSSAAMGSRMQLMDPVAMPRTKPSRPSRRSPSRGRNRSPPNAAPSMRSACLPPDEGGNQHAIKDNQWQAMAISPCAARAFHLL